MKVLYAVLAGAALFAYTALPAGENSAAAEPQVASSVERYLCDERTSVVNELTHNFQEKPVAVGLQGNGTLLEVFASNETGSWTILVTLPTGVTCLTLVGDSFEMLPPQPDGPRV